MFRYDSGKLQWCGNLWAGRNLPIIFANIVNENNSGLHCNDELILLRNVNGQKMGHVKKNVIKIFKGVGFKIEIQTHHKKVRHY